MGASPRRPQGWANVCVASWADVTSWGGYGAACRAHAVSKHRHGCGAPPVVFIPINSLLGRYSPKQRRVEVSCRLCRLA
jgi:hypothetical protein